MRLGFWQSRREIFEGEKKNLKEGRKKKRASGRRRYEKKSGEV